MPEATVLIVDDDPVFSRVLATELSDLGYTALQGGAEDLLPSLKRQCVDVVLLDIVMPGIGGLELLKSVRALDAPPEVVMVTGHGSMSAAVKALRYGARDFLTKPVERRALDEALKRCLACRPSAAVGPPPAPLNSCHSEQLIGYSPAMQRVRSAISRHAQSDSTVLIQGESGTGKDLVASLIHRNSDRQRAPFMVVDCTALAEQLLASELFGYERGSFTGAVESRRGIFSVADGGSVFLDEIGDMALDLQIKLLRVVETKSFRTVGGRKPLSVDVRILAATNSDLNLAVQKGSFRKDLYYRLAVCRVDLPPLRSHPEDIPLLVDHFRAQLAQSYDRVPTFSSAALRKLACYGWPGNVRELRNLIEQTVTQCAGREVEAEDLDLGQASALPPNHAAPNREIADLRRFEEEHMRDVLVRTGGNKSAAARVLGIDRKTLRRRLRRNGGDI